MKCIHHSRQETYMMLGISHGPFPRSEAQSVWQRESEENLHVARNTMAPLLVLLSVLLVSCAAQSWLRNGGRGEVGMGTVLHRLIQTIHFLHILSPLGEKNGYAQFYPRPVFSFPLAVEVSLIAPCL
jgi:uncharacterized membrane protein YczE